TSKGTPVKSCKTMRATRKGISSARAALGFQAAKARTLCSDTLRPSQLRSTDSKTRRIETGKREIGPKPAFSRAGSEENRPCRPSPKSKLCSESKRLCGVVIRSLRLQSHSADRHGQSQAGPTVSPAAPPFTAAQHAVRLF